MTNTPQQTKTATVADVADFRVGTGSETDWIVVLDTSPNFDSIRNPAQPADPTDIAMHELGFQEYTYDDLKELPGEPIEL